ncbi:MAG: hypothetical protein R6V49_04550 [Bacteroidales bacterium]
MNRKVLVLIVLALIAIATFLIVWFFVYNKPHPDYAAANAEYSLTPEELFNAYVLDKDGAATLYNGRILEISGSPDAFESVDSLTIAVFQMDEGMFGPIGVRCTFLEALPEDVKLVGKTFTIKGFCTGYNGEDVILEKCTLVNP